MLRVESFAFEKAKTKMTKRVDTTDMLEQAYMHKLSINMLIYIWSLTLVVTGHFLLCFEIFANIFFAESTKSEKNV